MAYSDNTEKLVSERDTLYNKPTAGHEAAYDWKKVNTVINEKINNIDVATLSQTNKFLRTITQTDGYISATFDSVGYDDIPKAQTVTTESDSDKTKAGILKVKTGNGLDYTGGSTNVLYMDLAGTNPGAVKVTTGNGLNYDTSTGAISLSVGSTSGAGALQVSSGNGLSVNSGVISLSVGSTSAVGALKVTKGTDSGNTSSGLDVSSGVLSLTDCPTFTQITVSSSRKKKKNVEKYTGNALKILDNVDIVKYNYLTEKNTDVPHIGFIAEDVPVILSGKKKDKHRIADSIGLLIKAVQELNEKVEKIEKEINKKCKK